MHKSGWDPGAMRRCFITVASQVVSRHQNIPKAFLSSYTVILLCIFIYSQNPVDEVYQAWEDDCRDAVFSFKQNNSWSNIFRRILSPCFVFCLYSHCALKWTIPHSQCVLVKYTCMVELPTAFELSLYERCWKSGTMHHKLGYYTHIFQQHPCQEWMAVHTFSSARGGRGDFSCLILFIFLFLGGWGRGGGGYMDA